MVSESFFESFQLTPTASPERTQLETNWKRHATPIRNQGDRCGSCYAFGTVDLLASVRSIMRGGDPPSEDDWLSPQEVVECSSFYGNFGCTGGNSGSTLQFLSENGAVAEKDYPYIDAQRRCSLINKSPVLFADKFFKLEPGNQELLKTALTKTPVVVAMNMDKLFLYAEGVFSDWTCDTQDLDHVVLLVGFGTDERTGEDYWLLKNSYGPDWGENGFFRIRRTDEKRKVGICGVTERAFISTIKLFQN